MGLSVVHGIVTNHGGTITVSSEPDKGSTFTVYLPKLLKDSPGTPEMGITRFPGGTKGYSLSTMKRISRQ